LKHEIKRDADNKVYISDVTLLHLDPNSASEIEKVMELASRYRSVGATQMNEQSSRSHSVFTLYLRASQKEEQVELNGTLSLVDLAGSERLERSGVTGDRAKEAVAINKSLSALTDVFTAIGNKQAFIPFRNSKLTYLLQPALSGDGKTLMMVNLSPTAESYNESLYAMKFAAQVCH
jgi:kinesin family protein C1